MTTAGFTWDGKDLGALFGLILEKRQNQLLPHTRDRAVAVPNRPGSHDFGDDLGERHIGMDCFINQASVANLDTAIAGISAAFDPTNEVSGDRGFKQLIFDTATDRYYLAKLTTGMGGGHAKFTVAMAIDRLVTTGQVKLQFRCADPFAYSTTQYVAQGGQATLTGFSAYRQAPEKIGWNLVKNGGFIAAVGSEFTMHATAARVVDAASPSGYAYRQIATAGDQNSYQDVPVEAGKAYSLAYQAHGDGTNGVRIFIDWLDAAGTRISLGTLPGYSTAAAYAEVTTINQTAPGNARTARLTMQSQNAGIFFVSAIRWMQQAGAPAAWTAAHQQLLTQKGLEIQDAATNIATDGDMEAAGTASYAPVSATLTKDTGIFFAGAKSLKVVSSGVDGRAIQNGALAAGQAIAISIRAKGGDANCRLDVISTPSNVAIGAGSMNNPNTTDWNTLRVVGVIAPGDTGYSARLVAGANTVVAYFDNFAVESKAYDSLNADPSGLAYAAASRVVSSVQVPVPSGFSWTDFAAAGVVRFDHAYTRGTYNRMLVDFWVDANNRFVLYVSTANTINFYKARAGVASIASDGAVTAFAAGDTIAWAIRFSAVGMMLYLSKNGGAVATYPLTTPDALLPIVGTTATLNVGRDGSGAGGSELAGTIGVLRILKGGLTDAQISAIVLAPYAAEDESIEMDVWRFDGSAAPENYGAPTLHVDVGGTYKVDPVVEITAGGAFTGNLTVTDANGNVFTWNGTLALNDVLKIDSSVFRAYLNSAVSMAGVSTASKWPSLIANQRNDLVVGGIASANIKAIKCTWRNRWL